MSKEANSIRRYIKKELKRVPKTINLNKRHYVIEYNDIPIDDYIMNIHIEGNKPEELRGYVFISNPETRKNGFKYGMITPENDRIGEALREDLNRLLPIIKEQIHNTITRYIDSINCKQ